MRNHLATILTIFSVIPVQNAESTTTIPVTTTIENYESQVHGPLESISNLDGLNWLSDDFSCVNNNYESSQGAVVDYRWIRSPKPVGDWHPREFNGNIKINRQNWPIPIRTAIIDNKFIYESYEEHPKVFYDRDFRARDFGIGQNEDWHEFIDRNWNLNLKEGTVRPNNRFGYDSDPWFIREIYDREVQFINENLKVIRNRRIGFWTQTQYDLLNGVLHRDCWANGNLLCDWSCSDNMGIEKMYRYQNFSNWFLVEIRRTNLKTVDFNDHIVVEPHELNPKLSFMDLPDRQTNQGLPTVMTGISTKTGKTAFIATDNRGDRWTILERSRHNPVMLSSRVLIGSFRHRSLTSNETSEVITEKMDIIPYRNVDSTGLVFEQESLLDSSQPTENRNGHHNTNGGSDSHEHHNSTSGGELRVKKIDFKVIALTGFIIGFAVVRMTDEDFLKQWRTVLPVFW